MPSPHARFASGNVPRAQGACATSSAMNRPSASARAVRKAASHSIAKSPSRAPEELAFRGVLLGAARKAMPFWAGILFVSAAFGSIHILNTFITGDLGGAAMQAMNAFLSGLAYLAIRIRTRSFVPIFIAHWLWDLVVFLNASSVHSGAASSATMNPLMGTALVAPITLYGLWIIRKRQYQFMTDDLPEDAPGQAVR